MSRVARAGGASMKRLAEDGDICPVCKSSRYLNPNMRFLVNPECYHKMCESCVDRIYSHGPAPCAIAGCGRTLRKARFRSQTFEDLKVEREVDIRRRVAKAMDKVESDFETLKDYNDYLEEVEAVTWNLILKIDVENTERKLRLWEEAQKAELNPNAPRRVTEPDPSQLSETAHVVLKKGATQRKALATSSGNGQDSFADDENRETGFTFRGLKKRKAPTPEKPFDPFEGWSIEPQYYILQDDYGHNWYAPTKEDPQHYAGGYDMREYYSRALCDAFGGMDIFIEDDMIARENQVGGNVGIGIQPSATAALGGKDVNMDDVF